MFIFLQADERRGCETAAGVAAGYHTARSVSLSESMALRV
jgi:hypothetical protein